MEGMRNFSFAGLGNPALLWSNLADGNLTAAQAILSSTENIEQIDVNYNNFYSILTSQDSVMNTTDSLTLFTLANACPYTDGFVVYQARALYIALFGNDYAFIDICDTKSDSGLSKKVSQNANSIISENSSELLIYPNPNNGFFEIFSPYKLVKIELYDLVGKMLYVSFSNEKSNNYQINEKLTNGLYTILLTNEKGENYVKKITVQNN